jgi:hypothetical protein
MCVRIIVRCGLEKGCYVMGRNPVGSNTNRKVEKKVGVGMLYN